MIHQEQKAFVIVGCEQKGLTKQENDARNAMMKRVIEDLGLAYKPVEGVTKAGKESGFLVLFRNRGEYSALAGIAFDQFGQTNVFVSDKERNCRLIHKDGRMEPLGRLTSTNFPSKDQSYTYCPKLDTYYVIKE